MRLLDRIRSMFTSRPTVGEPSTGTLMERGEGDMASHRDEVRATATRRDFGAPNDSLEDLTKSPIE